MTRSDQADAVLEAMVRAIPSDAMLGVYLYGSTVVGGLQPDSDLDLFGIVRRRLADAEKRALIEGLMPISGRATRPSSWRPVELTLVVQDEVRHWRYPPRCDFQYGEWLRPELLCFLRGELAPWPAANPDIAVLITMVRASSVPLFGPSSNRLLDPVPRRDLVRAMLDELPSLVADLESDTRNVVLALARIWTTVATGEVRSKDAAADWGLARLPDEHRPMLAQARAAYLGEMVDRWDDMGAVRLHADLVVGEIRRAAAT